MEQQRKEYHSLELNLKATESHRFTWMNQYFDLEAHLVFDSKLDNLESSKNQLENLSAVFKLIPFENQFKSKLFSHILQEEHDVSNKFYVVFAKINIFEKKLIQIQHTYEVSGKSQPHGTFGHTGTESEEAKLTADEQNSLLENIQKLLYGPMLAHFTQPFVALFPELLEDGWQERMPLKRGKQEAELVPYQAIFPFAGALELQPDGEHTLALDDLYCTNEKCDCRDVACVVLGLEKLTGKQEILGGFRYHFDKKRFKAMPEVPLPTNGQEWIKRFSVNFPIKLEFLFEARYEFIRKLAKMRASS